MHRFGFIELFMFFGNDVIAISSLGVISCYFWLRILKWRPDFIFMFNGHFLSILNGLDVIRLIYLAGISLLGAQFGEFLGKMTPKTSNERKNLLAWHCNSILTPNGVFWAILRESISCLACAGMQEKRQEERQKGIRKEEKSQEVYISLYWFIYSRYTSVIFHVCVERPLVGGLQPIDIANVYVSRT